MHLWREAQREMVAQPPFCQHAYREPRIPLVGIAHNQFFVYASVLVSDTLRTYVFELNILHVQTHQNAYV